jgi:methylase of polypeptide subunit release factors
VASAAAALTRDGVLVLETLGGTQTPVVAALMRTAGFTEVTTRADLTGVERFVAGRWS